MKIAMTSSYFIKLFPDIDHTPYSITAIIYNLSEELVKRGHDVTVFATSDSETSAKLPPNLLKSTDKNVLLARKHIKTHKEYYTKHYEKIITAADQFDLIHSHYNDFTPYSKQTTTPVVTTLHGPQVSNKDNLRYKNEKMVAISKSQMANNPNLNFVGLAYNGIRISEFKFNKKPQKYLAWLGRINPVKGPLVAINIAKQINKKIILAGNIENFDQEYNKKFFQEIKINKKLARYIGEVDKKAKNNLLKNATATLMPINIDEAFGLVAIESMACGTPVIAFNRGALPEIIKNGKTGFIVNNEQEMIEAIKKIDQIDRAECRRHVEENFTVEKTVDQYEEIYKKVIKKSKNK